ncbi:MAG: VCBS repeat-containing protein, partial [bacterium]|nr:VCBS repeat-containing protein [bacterium]
APVSIFKLVKDDQGKGTGAFKQTTISEGGQGHGLGFGDVNGDGRADVILNNGWLEAPEDPYTGKWTVRRDFRLGGHASVPIIVHDVNGDKRNDIIVGGGHGYLLDWWEQGVDGDGKSTWTKHVIDSERSQYHDLRMVDIDNDGELELVTGKRYRAHCGKDPGGNDPIGLYYFEVNGGKFDRVTLDYGTPDKASGAGIFFWVQDLNGNGWKDIIAPGKEGLYIFWNQGKV